VELPLRLVARKAAGRPQTADIGAGPLELDRIADDEAVRPRRLEIDRRDVRDDELVLALVDEHLGRHLGAEIPSREGTRVDRRLHGRTGAATIAPVLASIPIAVRTPARLSLRLVGSPLERVAAHPQMGGRDT